MLEQEHSLATWALRCEPLPMILEQGIACDQLPEHRKHYLDYEGPISNNRGHVSQWDSGSILHFEQQDERLLFRLSGRRLTGDYQLKRISDVTKSEQSKWMFYAVNGESVAQATD
jgi:hypothetical protein